MGVQGSSVQLSFIFTEIVFNLVALSQYAFCWGSRDEEVAIGASMQKKHDTITAPLLARLTEHR